MLFRLPRVVGNDGPEGKKVENVINERGLEGLGDELIRLWMVEDNTAKSVRELSRYVNK